MSISLAPKKEAPGKGAHQCSLENTQKVSPKKPGGKLNDSPLVAARVSVSLKIIDGPLPRAPLNIGQIRAECSESGQRKLKVTLQKSNVVVADALIRNDRTTLKFLIAILLSEWIQWWFWTRDGRQVKLALVERSQIPELLPEQRFAYWSALATGLVGSRLFKPIDFHKLTVGVRQELFSFTAQLPEAPEAMGWLPKKPKS